MLTKEQYWAAEYELSNAIGRFKYWQERPDLDPGYEASMWRCLLRRELILAGEHTPYYMML